MAILNEMERDLVFLDFTGLDGIEKIELLRLIHSPMKNAFVQFPWDEVNSEQVLTVKNEEIFQKVRSSGLNVYAPSFMSKWDSQNTTIVSEKESSNKRQTSFSGATPLSVPSTSLSVTVPFVVSASHPSMQLLHRSDSSLQTLTSVQTPPSQTCEVSQSVTVPSLKTIALIQSVNTTSLQTSLLTEFMKAMPLETCITSQSMKASSESFITTQSVDTPLLQTSLLTELNSTPLHPMKTSKSESTVSNQSTDTPSLQTSSLAELVKDTPLQTSLTTQPVITQPLKMPSSETLVPLLVHAAPIPLSQAAEKLSVKTNIGILPIATSTSHSVESAVDYGAFSYTGNHNLHKLDVPLKYCAGDKQSCSQFDFPNLVSTPVTCNRTIKKQPNPTCTFAGSHKNAPFPRSENSFDCRRTFSSPQKVAIPISSVCDTQHEQPLWVQSTKPKLRSFADVLKEKESFQGLPVAVKENNCDKRTNSPNNSNGTISSIDDDKFAVDIGRYFKELIPDFSPVSLQPRGLINSGNWCYMNASIQALLACSPFYRLLKNLPVQLGVNRGKSSTPILDNMVSLAREFISMSYAKDGFKRGSPFHPEKIYDQIGLWKSDCLKGQQEDAEEFLSYILNGIHGEIVTLMKNYESKNNPDNIDIDSLNNNTQVEEFDTEDEWQVMGANRRGIITRKVVDNKSIISDLVGGEFKTFLTTNGKTTTSASVQPFFTLQLDIQAGNVTNLEEALNQLTVKEPVQGYTCSKTNQEVEAYSKIFIQKLPPILIFHLKRFVYNPNGGCKKLTKCTDFPIFLEIKRDLLSPDVRKSKKPSSYRLFAVMYHDGEEAMKGHYLTDIYNYGNRTWIRCDDRNISSINEFQVLSYRPPRVPYLLFYQAMNPLYNKR